MKKIVLIAIMSVWAFSCRNETIEEDLLVDNSAELSITDLPKISSSALLQSNVKATLNINPKNWLGLLDDDTQLKDITLIGSHDAGAYRRGGAMVKTQEDDIKTQLESGVRYLDIRLNYEENTQSLVVYHGIVSQHLDFTQDVLRVVSDFLKKNPSEMVFLVVKNENGKYASEWKTKINQDFSRYASQILSHYDTHTPLKSARGKMLIISRAGYLDYGKDLWGYRNNDATFGYLGDERVFFSDKYSVPTILPKAINEKASVIFDAIYKAQQEKYQDSWFITNANGSSAFAYPADVASRINPMLSDYLSQHIYKPYNTVVDENFMAKRSGIIVIDFATSEKGKRIIDWAMTQSVVANNKAYQNQVATKVGFIRP